ncbi:ABC transporter permease [Crocinitomicaceae bacterium]|nr:ABC transporter permease [Crocinitomicaceae bacterium]MDC0257759.1 ABC transporter permease [Crocinitomicaceae bacterium]
MLKILKNIGNYIQMIWIVFSRPEKGAVFRRRLLEEIQRIGVESIPIVGLMSLFMGGVIALQTASNMDSPLLPEYTIGYITRSSTILEFSPTIMSLILAGKVGSNVASEIGTMRITEQIDALEIMGVNSRAYLILPKILGAVYFFPILIIFSMGLCLLGGWLALTTSGLASTETYLYGIRAWFEINNIFYALTKGVVFAFLIVSIASWYGYYSKGGAIDVGKSATRAVVTSSIAILIANFLLTQMILL